MPTVDALVVADDATVWRSHGFAVDADGHCPVGAVRLRLVGRDHGAAGIRSWALRGLDAAGSIDGLVTGPSQQPAANVSFDPAPHPNGTVAIDHLVVVTPDLERTVEALRRSGLAPRRTRHAGGGRRQVFFRLGEVILEVVGPAVAEGDGRARFWGLAFSVSDLDRTAAVLGERLAPPHPAVQPGRRIATVRRHPGAPSVPLAFLSPHVTPRRPGREAGAGRGGSPGGSG